jgi:hypothetical protein
VKANLIKAFKQFSWTRFVLFCCLLAAFSHICAAEPAPEITTSDDQSTVIVNDAPEQEVYVFGKSVIVNKRAKGVLAIGGDVVVEGRVEGDVATIGGNVIQKENAYIGGDVIVFGGAYKAESPTPQRVEGKETVMFGVFEEELRNIGQNPASLLSPDFSAGFFAQRLVLALFWFIISIVMTTVAPGAVSRAVARLNLTSLKICALGTTSFLFLVALMVAGALVLPNYLSVTIGLMTLLLMMLAYVFGRVSLQVTLGKMVQKHFLATQGRSETVAILIGVLIWTFILSIPYLWVVALLLIFAFGLGLILTGRTSLKWQNT